MNDHEAGVTKLLVTLAVSLSLLVGGCAFSKVKKGDFEAFSVRVLWATEGFNASYDPVNGTYDIGLGNTGQDLDGAIEILKAAK